MSIIEQANTIIGCRRIDRIEILEGDCFRGLTMDVPPEGFWVRLWARHEKWLYGISSEYAPIRCRLVNYLARQGIEQYEN